MMKVDLDNFQNEMEIFNQTFLKRYLMNIKKILKKIYKTNLIYRFNDLKQSVSTIIDDKEANESARADNKKQDDSILNVKKTSNYPKKTSK